MRGDEPVKRDTIELLGACGTTGRTGDRESPQSFRR